MTPESARDLPTSTAGPPTDRHGPIPTPSEDDRPPKSSMTPGSARDLPTSTAGPPTDRHGPIPTPSEDDRPPKSSMTPGSAPRFTDLDGGAAYRPAWPDTDAQRGRPAAEETPLL